MSEKFDVKSRDFTIPLDTNKIITFIGIRRCGKTSIMYDCINEVSKHFQKRKAITRSKKIDTGECNGK